MPSIVYRSSSMVARRLALTSQNVTEQANGLVEVGLEYSAAASDRAAVVPLFKTDTAPPIRPSIVDYDALQTRTLYLRNFRMEQANGLLNIFASYVGANFSALQTPALFSDFESFSFNVNVPAFFGPITPTLFLTRYDYYGFEVTLRIEEQQAAVIGNQNITLTPPPAITEGGREGLMRGGLFKSRVITSGYVPYRDQPQIGFPYRDLTANELLTLMATKQDSGISGFSVVKTQKVEHITPTVKLLSDVYQAELNPAGLSALGISIQQ